jgi:hypothetical protein
MTRILPPPIPGPYHPYTLGEVLVIFLCGLAALWLGLKF